MLATSTPPRKASRRDDDRLDRMFGALANRTRRAMLVRLGRGPAMITDVAGPLKMTLPAVSKHLRVLEEAGFVRREIDGRIHRCSLDVAALADAERWLSHYRAFWESSLDALARHVEDRES